MSGLKFPPLLIHMTFHLSTTELVGSLLLVMLHITVYYMPYICVLSSVLAWQHNGTGSCPCLCQ